MRKIFAILLLATAVTFSVKAQKAKTPEKQSTSLSVGAEVGLPTGDLALAESAGLGISAKVAFPVMTDGAITGSVGYVSFLHKTDAVSWNTVPVKVGFRYNIAGSGFNIEPQAGYTIGGSDMYDAKMSDFSGFTWAIGAGYFFTKNIDLGVRYESTSITGGTASFVGFRVAYNFSLGGKK